MNADEKVPVTALTDEQVAEATGGYEIYEDESHGRYYFWKGSDRNLKYLCPKCGKPVYTSNGGFTYKCDPCSDWYFLECRLNPNLANWTEVTKEEYERETKSDEDGYHDMHG